MVRNKKLLGSALAIAMPFLPAGCTSQPTPYGAANKTWTSRFSGAMKDGADKAASALTPKSAPPDDPISLSSKPKKKTPELYVALGLAQERSSKTAEAEKMYKKALE